MFDYTLKVIVFGDSGVGKTTLSKTSSISMSPKTSRKIVGVDFYVKDIQLRHDDDFKRIKMQIWKINNEERFKFQLPNYCLGSKGALLVYDITNQNSLEHLFDWIQIIRKRNNDFPIILVGNKLDLHESRAIKREKGIQAVEKYNLNGFIEISAKTGQNVKQAFRSLSKLMMSWLEHPQPKKAVVLTKEIRTSRAKKETPESISEPKKKDISVITIEKTRGRRKCPTCNTEERHLIYEFDDKTHVILNYPRVYGKKYICRKCGCQWREI